MRAITTKLSLKLPLEEVNQIGIVHLPLGALQLLAAVLHLPANADDASLLGLQLGGVEHQVQASPLLHDGGELGLGDGVQLLDDVLHLIPGVNNLSYHQQNISVDFSISEKD